MSDLLTPYEYAGELLELCSNAIAETEGGEIARRYVSAGRPAFDCEQLTVHLVTLGDAQSTGLSPVSPGRRHISGKMNLLGMVVTVVRDCAATMDDQGNPPAAEDLEQDARTISQDIWACWTGIYAAMKEGELFGGKCDLLFFDGAQVLDSEGQTNAWELGIRAEIPGIIVGSG